MKKFALITGASGGIGRAIALKLASDGYSLYLHYNKNEASIMELLDLLTPYNGEYIPIQADLSAQDGYKKIADNIFSIESIIHNSGMSQYGLFVDNDKETVEKMMMIHMTVSDFTDKRTSP